MHNYHAALNCFPPGFMAQNHLGEIKSGWGWSVFLMPFIEQSPLQDATVEFQPLAKGMSSSSGKTDINGHYRLMHTLHSVGAVPGKYAVSVRSAETCFDETGHEYEREERVPAKYNSKTVVTRTVEPGRNTFDFDL